MDITDSKLDVLEEKVDAEIRQIEAMERQESSTPVSLQSTRTTDDDDQTGVIRWGTNQSDQHLLSGQKTGRLESHGRGKQGGPKCNMM